MPSSRSLPPHLRSHLRRSRVALGRPSWNDGDSFHAITGDERREFVDTRRNRVLRGRGVKRSYCSTHKTLSRSSDCERQPSINACPFSVSVAAKATMNLSSKTFVPSEAVSTIECSEKV